jgi:dTDP-4-amino-4,6-dideoxygalactose transaminase
VKKISLATPHLSRQGYEKQFVEEAFNSNWIAPLGPMVNAFEHEINTLLHSPYSVALSSGTAAIHLALKALGVQEGDIVLCQSLTFAASANPILYEKAIPVFVDSESDTWNMSPLYLEAALKKYKNVKAVIVVHLYGIPAKIDQIKSLCEQYKVALIEDAAESLGSTFKGQYTGTFGDIGVLSFNGNKIITTSGGGMALSKNRNFIEKMRFWATQSRDPAKHYEHSELGYNYRLSNISAAIGRGQLKVLEERIKKKRDIYRYYKEKLKHFTFIKFMPIFSDDTLSNCWLTSIIIEPKYSPSELIDHLAMHNIEARPLWKPLHLQPFFKSYSYVGTQVSESLFKQGLCLPSDTKLEQNDLDLVIQQINLFFK